METADKLAMLKSLLKETSASDVDLTVYLDLSKAEILSWLYSGKTPEGVTDVPAQYEPTQIMACVAGYSQSGAEGQLSHNENGVSRTWKHEDMVAYVRSRVIPYAVVI